MGHTIASDADLLAASRRGEHAAFGALVEKYQDIVCAVSYSRTRDRSLSEDVAQETFIAAWRQLHQLRDPSMLRSWLCGIARNLARKARRRSDREQLVDAPVVLAGDDPFAAVCEAEAERVVGDALARVPETYRDVMVLYYREQRSAREVAELLGISEAATLQRLARGREYLAKGVTALVEKSLRGQRTRRFLVAGVLAALPVAVPSPVDASTSSHGGHMLKIALAVAALGAVGTTTAVVYNSRGDSPPPAAAVAANVTADTPAPSVTPTPPPAAPPSARADAPVLPDKAAPSNVAPPPDTTPTITKTKLAQLGLDRGPSRGPVDAPVTIVVFTNAMCKYCGLAYGSIDQLFDDYPNKLKLIVKQMPVLPQARLSAEAAYAAEAQGKFWELHDLMFAHPDDLSRDALIELAKQAGLDVAAFTAALDAHTYADAVAADMDAAQKLEIQGTPTFLINGRRIIGNRPLEALRAAVDAALADS